MGAMKDGLNVMERFAGASSMAGILDTIDTPEDLRSLEIGQLPELAEEIRERITNVVSRNGGHFAPSMGAVELTLALHYVFNTPDDKLIWDVGHQAYVHKLITGRRERFPTLRQYGGISGFTKRSESVYDPFGAGHASTSISAALGIATARDLIGEDYRVIAVIGDGAMTGGLAFEGLNNAGASGRELVVVLNDNGMSISPNVGALSRYFTDLIASHLYNRIKADIWELTGRLSSFGEYLRSLVARVDDSIKSLIVPGILFERLGFRYFGPVDGHDVAHLIRIFRDIWDLSGPILVHVSTTKGKGCSFAEEDASRFHGSGPFDKVTGVSVGPKRGPSYSEVFGKTLTELAETRDQIVAITAAMCDGTGLRTFSERFPDRFFDVGISEGHAVTFAAGLATSGFRPVVAIYSTFLQRAFDHIIHDVALQALPVVFALDRGGLVGEDGPTHHGAFDLSYLRQIPGMVVMAPKDENELRVMLRLAVEYEDGPVGLRYPRGTGRGLMDGGQVSLSIGRGEILREEGEDVTILAVGSMVWPCMDAAEILEEEGISAQVVNMRFVKPLDGGILQRIHEEGRPIVTVEENTVEGGFGSAVMEFYEKRGIGGLPIRRLGIPDRFIPHGSKEILMSQIGLNPGGIAAQVRKFLHRCVPVIS